MYAPFYSERNGAPNTIAHHHVVKTYLQNI